MWKKKDDPKDFFFNIGVIELFPGEIHNDVLRQSMIPPLQLLNVYGPCTEVRRK